MATRQSIVEQQAALLAFLVASADAIGIEAIAAGTGLGLDRRTLLRRLDALLKDGGVIRVGQSSDTRYQAAPRRGIDTIVPQRADAPVVALSTAGAKVRAAVTRPIGPRPIVGYERRFLDRYKPNVTSYLTGAERRHLRALGEHDHAF